MNHIMTHINYDDWMSFPEIGLAHAPEISQKGLNWQVFRALYKIISAQSAQDFDAKSVISEQDEFFTPMISEAVSETSTLVGSRESLVEVGIAKKERSFSVVEQEQLEKTLTEIANQQK